MLTAPAPRGPRHHLVRCAGGTADVWWHLAQGPATPGRGRRLLAHALRMTYGAPARDAVLVRDPWGRPALLSGRGLPRLHLSATHCGHLTVAVVAERFPVGIDAEALDGPPSPTLIRYALTARERADLAGLPEEERVRAFQHMWTAKEAMAKGLGWPLLRALVDVEVALRPRLRLARLGSVPCPRGWELRPLRLAELPGPDAAVTVTLAARLPVVPAARARTVPVARRPLAFERGAWTPEVGAGTGGAFG
ncbi:4'-phosphopantetheinyl transferase superfamily protein [Streptomyces sp. NPDC001941]|uniref:4'-phosphopantetheinyl transferase family protein n=1 Tax=Streptomyces sp. NPDC001941 TaxID=3154659 RepID=UPI00332B92BF